MNKYICQLPNTSSPAILENEKYTFFNLVYGIVYIYNLNEGENIEPSVEKWLKTDSTDITITFKEQECKRFLREFRSNFDKYKDLNCFKNLRGFHFDAKNAEMYSSNNEDLKIFDINAYLDFVSVKVGDKRILKDASLLSDTSQDTIDMSNVLADFEVALRRNYAKTSNIIRD